MSGTDIVMVDRGADRVADGIWTLGGQGNSLLVDHGEGLLLVDAGPGRDITERMIRDARRVCDKPLTHIVISHGHLGYNFGVAQWRAHAASRGEPRPVLVGHERVTVRYRRYTETSGLQDDDAADDATGGAVAGAVTGLGVGALIGAGVLAGVIPVVGPALFAGTLGVLASNAAGGAAVVGLVGALTGWGLSEEDATYYEGEVSAGRSIVTVTSARSEEAEQIMRRQGGTPRQRSSSQTSMR